MTAARTTAAYLRCHPASLSPLVLTCEHATHRLPAPHRASAGDRPLLRSHWGWDPGAWAVTRELSRRLGCGAIGGRWSRLLIDLNRRIDDPTLIRPEAEGIALSFNRRVGVAERERRIATFHVPYHAEVDRQLTRRIVRGVRPVLLAVHSFTPTLHHRPRRFDVGVLYEDHVRLARRLAAGCRAAGFRTRYNEPYSGMAGMMYAADRHGSHLDLPCLEIEINQARIDSPAAAREVAGRLVPAIGALTEGP
jgi:predicted N-formylglutamate amidohydrolase